MGKRKSTAKKASEAFILERGRSAGDDWVTVSRENIRPALEALKAEGWDWLSFLTCVDHLANPAAPRGHARFELVYQLRRMGTPDMLRVSVGVPADDPRVDSVQDIHAPAGWDERETWDFFGIHFDGHPGLKRILMPDDWEGHPLRRDFPVGGEPVDFSEDHQEWQTKPEKA